MKEYLRRRFFKDNIPKYHKYFDLWYNNLTTNQLEYFKLDLLKCIS